MAYGQLTCPILTSPENNATDVPVDASITWTRVDGVPGYIISLGTAPGGTDIINRARVGNSVSYFPPQGLPENTVIYVTITLFFFDQDDLVCEMGKFQTETISEVPACTSIKFPADEDININVNTSIRWNYAPKATGYRITLGTFEGATDIIDDLAVGNVLDYRPTQDLPVDQDIFVRIVPENSNGQATGNCETFSFTTSGTEIRPQCSMFVNPANGAINVPLTPRLEWMEVPQATEYLISIGTTPTSNDILDNLVFRATSTYVINFEPNSTFFATVIPRNSAGQAIGCLQTTFSTILGCTSYVNNEGERVSLRPEVSFPEQISFCKNKGPQTFATNDVADGFRWYKINGTTEELLSTEREVTLSEAGEYRYEAFNTASQAGNIIECTNSKEFTVVSSEIATGIILDVERQNGKINIQITTEGEGDYEFALDHIEGPFQKSNVFNNIAIGFHTVYVKDMNGCGVTEKILDPDLTVEGFPKFFTPNGDGVNDFWQFVPPARTMEIRVVSIQIFDRYGTLLAQIAPQEKGWDGSFKGKSLPASDYWFKAIDSQELVVNGHFTLKR